jgi:hypothetical protein
MAHETCEYHTQLVADIAVLKDNTNYIRNKICKHVDEGEKEGGFRDRLLLLEQAVSELKKAMWIRVAVAGAIGGLIGSGSNDVLVMFIKWIMK